MWENKKICRNKGGNQVKKVHMLTIERVEFFFDKGIRGRNIIFGDGGRFFWKNSSNFSELPVPLPPSLPQ